MDHVKYFSLVEAKGLLAAYKAYQRDGGVLGMRAFNRKYKK